MSGRNKAGWFKGFFMIFLLVFFVTSGQAAGKKKESLQSQLFGGHWFSGVWHYVPSTIPEYLSLYEHAAAISFGDGSGRENANDCSISFVSGDESLRNALKYRTEDDSLYLYVDNSAITAPGEARFHVVFNSEHYWGEDDYTIRVLSYDDYPLVTVRDPNPVVVLRKGEIFNPTQYGYKLFEENTRSISAALGISVPERDLTNYSTTVGWSASRYQKLFEKVRQGNRTVGYQASAYGSMKTNVHYSFGNVEVSLDLPIHILSYSIDGPDRVKPGETVQYTIKDEEPSDDKAFRWTVGGMDEITINSATGELTIPDTLKEGAFTVTATPVDASDKAGTAESGDSSLPEDWTEEGGTVWSPRTKTITWPDGRRFRMIIRETQEPDGSVSRSYTYGEEIVSESPAPPVSLQVRIAEGILSGYATESTPVGAFNVPLIVSEEFEHEWSKEIKNQLISKRTDKDSGWLVSEYFTETEMDEFMEWPEDAEAAYDKYISQLFGGVTVALDKKSIEIDGHPARLIRARQAKNGEFIGYCGVMYYARQNRVLTTTIYSRSESGAPESDVPDVSFSELEKIAQSIEFDESVLTVLQEDGSLTVQCKENSNVLSAGKKMNFSVSFKNSEVAGNKKLNSVLWSVLDKDTGAESEDVSISSKGQLTADKGLDKVLNLEVVAKSPRFHSEAVYPLTVLPAVAKIEAEPAELFFYAGTNEKKTVQVRLMPDTVPVIGITWTSSGKNTVEITPDDKNGSAVVKPVSAGKTAITVKEPGGKTFKVNVNVVEPVTDLELTAKGRTIPGGTVSITANLKPKNAGSKALEWSLNVDENTASINGKGQLKISKEAAPGTVIRVTCTASGAPKPVEATLEITVTE